MCEMERCDGRRGREVVKLDFASGVIGLARQGTLG